MDMSAAPAVVTKGKFAELTRVSPGRVSQWIAERKISGAALEGKGRGQRIRVEEACRQLKRTLDIGQRLGNGIDTRLEPTAPTPAAEQSAAPSKTPDAVEEQIKRARLKQIELQNSKAAEEAAARAGILTDAEAAQRQMGKIAAQLITAFESLLPDIATALAARFPAVPQRDALHIMRTEIHAGRSRLAAAMKVEAATLPELAEVEAVAELAPDQAPTDA